MALNNSNQVVIGDTEIPGIYALAPMAGVNCTAFRLLCKQAGAGLIYTQMYHADFICHKADKEGEDSVRRYINIQEAERPVSIQLVGHNPDTMVRAALIIQRIADIVDVNLGCCDTDIIKSGAGAHYMRHPEKIPGLFRPLIDHCKKPVTAKIRIGYDSHSINGVSMAAELEQLGIAAIAVHGRVATQKYSGKANWEIIMHIKQKLNIPVIGSGDVKSKSDANTLLARTGCDMVMIGRKAMGDPGIFARCTDTEYPDNMECFRKFMDYYERFDNDKSFSELRTHALWFAKRLAMGPKARDQLSRAKDRQAIDAVFAQC